MEYEIGARVLAYHGPLLYEAKILKLFNPESKKVLAKKHSRDGKESITSHSASQVPRHVAESADIVYYIHYKGWKTSWDEWVFDERLMPLTEENSQMADELKNQYIKKSGKSAPQLGQVEKGTTHPPKKPRKDPSLVPEDEYLATPEVAIAMPPSLKAALVDDWEFITKDSKVAPLPRDPSVAEILEKYAAQHKSQDTGQQEILNEIVSGLLLYFDRCLGNMLLYRQERDQYFYFYKKAKNDSFVPSTVYGGEHLLRLFVALPGLIAQTSMDKPAIEVLKGHCEDFLEWFSENEEEFLTQNYRDVKHKG